MFDNITPWWVISIPKKEATEDKLDLLTYTHQVAGSEEREDTWLFYIPESGTDALNAFEKSLQEMEITYEKKLQQAENWNKTWEDSLEPVELGTSWYIRAPFHPEKPGFDNTLIIEPQMAFGTGHHATTQMMLLMMEGMDLKLRRVCDLGCGSGILSIAAEKLGAAHITAIDHDPICTENTKANARANNCSVIEVKRKTAGSLEDLRYEIVLANINLNVLTDQMHNIETMLVPGGDLLVSGVLKKNLREIIYASRELIYIDSMEDENTDWICIHLRKKVTPIKTP